VSYPDNFLKGVSNKDLITPDGAGISAAVFHFDSEHVRNGWLEQSICWEDDGGAVTLMLGQRKSDGVIQFKAGVVRVPRSCVGYINKLPRTKDLLSYERQALDANCYHGNLLLKKDTHNRTMKIVAAMIAGHISDVIIQE